MNLPAAGFSNAEARAVWYNFAASSTFKPEGIPRFARDDGVYVFSATRWARYKKTKMPGWSRPLQVLDGRACDGQAVATSG